MNFSLRKGMITSVGREGYNYKKDYGNLSFYHLCIVITPFFKGLILFRETVLYLDTYTHVRKKLLLLLLVVSYLNLISLKK